MPDGHKSRVDQRSLLWIALGRQRVGKTALLNADVKWFRALGCHIEIWNADQQNRTDSLSTIFADAVGSHRRRPCRLANCGSRDNSSIRSTGGIMRCSMPAATWTGNSSLIEDMPVIQAHAQQGIDVIRLFCVGPEQADLHNRRPFFGERHVPSRGEKTVIGLNAGLVELRDRSAGRSVRSDASQILPSRPPSSVDLKSS